MDGSIDNVCNVDDGKCTCKDNIDGHNCDKSAKGWWNFPNPEGKSNHPDIRLLIKKEDYNNYHFSIFRMLM